jgi:hypothetical protein
MDCPDARYSAIMSYSNGLFSDHFEDIAWVHESFGNETNLAYVTAKGGLNPDEQTYSVAVTARFPATANYAQFECPFNLEWGRPDCRYYM